ncbi:Endo-1,4-beta-xylanase A precursor [compost metagenome]
MFADHAAVAEYAWESIALLTAAGILQGDGHGIRPLDAITRAEAAVMLYRVYNK